MSTNAADPSISPELSGTPTVPGDTSEHSSQTSSPTVLSNKQPSFAERISKLDAETKARIERDILNSDDSDDDDPSAPPVININKDGWFDASSNLSSSESSKLTARTSSESTKPTSSEFFKPLKVPNPYNKVKRHQAANYTSKVLAISGSDEVTTAEVEEIEKSPPSPSPPPQTLISTMEPPAQPSPEAIRSKPLVAAKASLEKSIALLSEDGTQRSFAFTLGSTTLATHATLRGKQRSLRSFDNENYIPKSARIKISLASELTSETEKFKALAMLQADAVREFQRRTRDNIRSVVNLEAEALKQKKAKQILSSIVSLATGFEIELNGNQPSVDTLYHRVTLVTDNLHMRPALLPISIEQELELIIGKRTTPLPENMHVPTIAFPDERTFADHCVAIFIQPCTEYDKVETKMVRMILLQRFTRLELGDAAAAQAGAFRTARPDIIDANTLMKRIDTLEAALKQVNAKNLTRGSHRNTPTSSLENTVGRGKGSNKSNNLTAKSRPKPAPATKTPKKGKKDQKLTTLVTRVQNQPTKDNPSLKRKVKFDETIQKAKKQKTSTQAPIAKKQQKQKSAKHVPAVADADNDGQNAKPQKRKRSRKKKNSPVEDI